MPLTHQQALVRSYELTDIKRRYTGTHTHTLLPAHARALTTDGALVTAVRTVTNSVTSADFRYTLSVGAFELRRCTICSTKHKAL